MAKQRLQTNIEGRGFTIKYEGDWIAKEHAMEDECKEMMATRIVSNTIPKNAYIPVGKKKMEDKSIRVGAGIIIDDSFFVIKEVHNTRCIIKCEFNTEKHYPISREVPTDYLVSLRSY